MALARDGPVIVDAVVNRQESLCRFQSLWKMAKGFSLYMVKANINRHTDEIIGLVKSNLWVLTEAWIDLLRNL